MTTDFPTPTADEPAFQWTDTDAAAAKEVLAEAQGSRPPRELIVLTDEEVVVLDGLKHAQLVPTPYLDATKPDLEVVAGTALRGLLARMLVAPRPILDAAGEPTGETKLTATKEILGSLMLRRTASTIVQIERQTNSGARWVFSYTHPGFGVLLEDVDANGLHVFGASDADGMVEYLDEIVNPAQVAGGEGPATHWSAAEFEALAEMPDAFAGAEATLVITAFNHGDDQVTSRVVYAGPQTLGLLVVEPDGSFTGRRVTAQTVRRLLADLVAGRPVD